MGDKLVSLEPHTVKFAVEFVVSLSDHLSVDFKLAQVALINKIIIQHLIVFRESFNTLQCSRNCSTLDSVLGIVQHLIVFWELFETDW